MPLNANIPLGIQPIQIPQQDPNAQFNMLAQALQAKQGLMQMEDLQRKRDDRNKMLGILGRSYGKPEEREDALLQGGFVDEAVKLGKDRREGLKLDNESLKAQREAQKAELEMGLKKAEHISSVLSLAKDPTTYSTVRAVIKSQLGQDLPEQYDPNVVSALIAQGQTITQRLAAEHQRMTLAETTRHNQTVEGETGRHNRASEGIQIRGQNLVDSRQREANAQGKTQIVETPQGFVIVDKNTGASRPAVGADGQPLKGKANDRVMTDAQAKANLFGTRMKESDRILNELEGKYNPMAVNAKMAAAEVPGVGGVAGYAGNLMLSEEGQRAEQAQRDFINAVLRRESGAVISPQEFANGQKQYFPQPGDTKAVLDQKRRNRNLAIQGMEAEVPGGFRGTPSLTGTGQSGGASGGWSIQKVN